MTLRSLAGDTLIYGTGYILGKVLNYLLITIYLTWKFDETEQYGLYTDFYFYVALLLVFLTFRMETTYFRFASVKGEQERVFSQASLIVLVTSILWVLFILFEKKSIANALEYPGYEKHVVTLGIILALDVLVSVPFAALRLAARPVRYSVLRLLGIVINIAAVVFFLEILPALAESGTTWAMRWYDHADRLYYVFLSNLIGSLVVFLVFLPGYFRIRLYWDRALARKMLSYAWPLVIVGVAGVINQSSYITFQKYILPNSLFENLSEGGIYAAATRIALLMSLFTIAFNYAAEPFFFRLYNTEGAKEMYAEVAKAFTVVGCVLMACILLYLNVVQFILGENYRSGLYIVPILLLGFFFLGLYYNFSVWYKITDKTIFGAYISIIGAIVTVGLNILLLPKLAIVGSAWTALACYSLMVTLCYLIGRRYYPVPYDLRRILLHTSAVFILYWISVQLGELSGPGLWKHIAINTALLMVYLVVLFRAEKQMILSIVRRAA